MKRNSTKASGTAKKEATDSVSNTGTSRTDSKSPTNATIDLDPNLLHRLWLVAQNPELGKVPTPVIFSVSTKSWDEFVSACCEHEIPRRGAEDYEKFYRCVWIGENHANKTTIATGFIFIEPPTDLAKLLEAPYVSAGGAINRGANSSEGINIVPESLSNLREKVFSLKLSPVLSPNATTTKDKAIAHHTLEPEPISEGEGERVFVGVIDIGGEFGYANFRDRKTGGTRMLSLWDQRSPDVRNANAKSPDKYGYGAEYSKQEMDLALKLNPDDPYSELGYDPFPSNFDPSEDHLHGTFVTDLAAGNGRATGHAGLCPDADLIFVHAGQASEGEVSGTGHDHDKEPADRQGRARHRVNMTGYSEVYTHSKYLVDAVDYIVRKAQSELRKDLEEGEPEPKARVVINISMSALGGPHGTSLTEIALDSMLGGKIGGKDDALNRAIVFAAGNYGEAGIYCHGEITPNEYPSPLEWNFFANNTSENAVGIWLAEQDQDEKHPPEIAFSTDGLEDLTKRDAPNAQPGKSRFYISPGRWYGFRNHNLRVFLAWRRKDPNNEKAHIMAFVQHVKERPRTLWKIKFSKMSKATGFNAWIENADEVKNQTHFLSCRQNEHTRAGTVNSVACGQRTIVVGSLHEQSTWLDSDPWRIAPYSGLSSEEIRDTTKKRPSMELMAPTSLLFGADPRVGMHIIDGTSFAAPQVAGMIAEYLRQDPEKKDYTVEQLAKAVLENSPNPDNGDESPDFFRRRVHIETMKHAEENAQVRITQSKP